MSNWVVKVTTEGHEFSGTNVIGPFDGQRAFEVERELLTIFAGKILDHGSNARAFPHGRPKVEVLELLDWSVEKLAWNWTGSDEHDQVSS